LYIPAVKDLRDDLKTAQSTPFGKILGILLKAIEPALTEEKELFEKLNPEFPF
jgi:putative ATP-dependent endonuclease of the OLD family